MPKEDNCGLIPSTTHMLRGHLEFMETTMTFTLSRELLWVVLTYFLKIASD